MRPPTLEHGFDLARPGGYAKVRDITDRDAHGRAAPHGEAEASSPPDRLPATPGGFPPVRGRGSGKAAWMGTALRLHEQNEGQAAIVDAQGALICDMQGEITVLKRQLAQHRPARAGAKPSGRQVENSYFQEIRHRSWARRHRLVVLIAAEAAIVVVVGIWLLVGAL